MSFIDRHLGPRSADAEQMLETLGYSSLDALMDAVVPSQIRLDGDCSCLLRCRSMRLRQRLLATLRRTRFLSQMIGAGYYDAVTPAVLRRNILENPVSTLLIPRTRLRFLRAVLEALAELPEHRDGADRPGDCKLLPAG